MKSSFGLMENVRVFNIITEVLATTLGPRGRTKFFILPNSKLIITNSGFKILKLLPLKHPIAKLIANSFINFQDGVKSSVIIANALLKHARKLTDYGIHPVTIMNGYKVASLKAIDFLWEKAERWEQSMKELLSIAKVPLSCRIVHIPQKEFSKIAVDACISALQEDDSTVTGMKVNLSLINILKEEGAIFKDSKLIKGMVIKKSMLYPYIPKKVVNAKIALLDSELNTKTKAIRVEIVPKDAKEIELLKKRDKDKLEEIVERIIQTGAKVIVSQKKVNPSAVQKFLRKGISCIDGLKKIDIDKLVYAIGGRIVRVIETLKSDDLGSAAVVEEVKIGLTNYIKFIRDTEEGFVTIMLRGTSKSLLGEAEKGIVDALLAVHDLIEDGMVVYGAGSIEVEIAKELRNWAQTIKGTEQMAIIGFASALEEIPRWLAKNAGFSPSKTLAELRDRHQREGYPWWGVDVKKGKPLDTKIYGIIESLRVKEQCINTAIELTETILTSDIIILPKPIRFFSYRKKI